MTKEKHSCRTAWAILKVLATTDDRVELEYGLFGWLIPQVLYSGILGTLRVSALRGLRGTQHSRHSGALSFFDKR